jgi:hypothetical protein
MGDPDYIINYGIPAERVFLADAGRVNREN